MGQEEFAEELHEFLHAKEKRERKTMKIIKDKKQFSVRIPMNFARALELDPKKDEIQFQLVLPKPNEEKPAKLLAVLEKFIS